MFRASQIYGRATPAPRPAASAAPRGKGGVDWNDSRVRDRYREEVVAARQYQDWEGGKSSKGGKAGKGSWYDSSWGPASDGAGYDDSWWGDSWGKAGGKGASADGGWWSSPSDWGKAGGKGGEWWTSSDDWGKAGAKGRTDASRQPALVPGDRGKAAAKGNGATSSFAGRSAARAPAPARTPPAFPSSSSGRPRASRVEPPPLSPNTITLQGSGLQDLGDSVVDEACRQVAIDGGFSVHENLVFVSSGTAHVEFPYREAAAQFAEAVCGEITIDKLTFKVRHPLSRAAVAPVVRNPDAEEEPDGETPTDSLMIKNLADVPESDLREAFEKIAPRLKSVKVIKDYAGHYKGMGTISFYEIHEAAMALRHFRNQGCMVAGRKVIAEFMAPTTIEQKVEQEELKLKASESVKASHAQALSGVNADMWASYLAMFKEEAAQEEPEAKRPRGSNYFT